MSGGMFKWRKIMQTKTEQEAAQTITQTKLLTRLLTKQIIKHLIKQVDPTTVPATVPIELPIAVPVTVPIALPAKTEQTLRNKNKGFGIKWYRSLFEFWTMVERAPWEFLHILIKKGVWYVSDRNDFCKNAGLLCGTF